MWTGIILIREERRTEKRFSVRRLAALARFKKVMEKLLKR